MMYKVEETGLGKLMSGVIYPAFLSLAVIGFVFVTGSKLIEGGFNGKAFTEVFGTVRIWYTMWFIVYFSITFVQLSRYSYKVKYSAKHFVMDVADVILIFVACYMLGYVNPKYINLGSVYYIFLLIPIIGGVSNYFFKKRILWGLSVHAIIISLLMIVKGHEYLFLNWLALGLYANLLFWYCVVYKKENELSD